MLVVLIQNPKGGGIDSTFGGSQANQMLGASRSTDMIEKITWGLRRSPLYPLCAYGACRFWLRFRRPYLKKSLPSWEMKGRSSSMSFGLFMLVFFGRVPES